MSSESIPGNDSEFDQFASKLVDVVTADPDKYGLTALEVAGLQAALVTWSAVYEAHKAAQDTAAKAAEERSQARDTIEALVRSAAVKIHATPGMDNATRVAAGLQPRSDARTIIGPPETRPIGRLEHLPHNRVVLHFADETTPRRLAKPAGVQGCQIWAHLGGDDAPTDDSAYAFIGLDTRTPYVDEHDPANAGKNIYYRLRWQNAKGEPGPWGKALAGKVPS